MLWKKNHLKKNIKKYNFSRLVVYRVTHWLMIKENTHRETLVEKVNLLHFAIYKDEIVFKWYTF